MNWARASATNLQTKILPHPLETCFDDGVNRLGAMLNALGRVTALFPFAKVDSCKSVHLNRIAIEHVGYDCQIATHRSVEIQHWI